MVMKRPHLFFLHARERFLGEKDCAHQQEINGSPPVFWF